VCTVLQVAYVVAFTIELWWILEAEGWFLCYIYYKYMLIIHVYNSNHVYMHALIYNLGKMFTYSLINLCKTYL